MVSTRGQHSSDAETEGRCQDSDTEASSFQEEEQQPLFCPELKPFIPLWSWPETC